MFACVREFGLYANVRPVRKHGSRGSIRRYRHRAGARNLGGLYVAFEHYIPIGKTIRTRLRSRPGSTPARIAQDHRIRLRLCAQERAQEGYVVHKANVLKALTGVFLEVGHEIAKKIRGQDPMDDRIVDATAMQLVMIPGSSTSSSHQSVRRTSVRSTRRPGRRPRHGPGANIGPDAAIFEAVHGSARYSGKGIANPLALLLAVGLMLEHVRSGGTANRLRTAIDQVLRKDGVRTPGSGRQGVHQRLHAKHHPSVGLVGNCEPAGSDFGSWLSVNRKEYRACSGNGPAPLASGCLDFSLGFSGFQSEICDPV